MASIQPSYPPPPYTAGGQDQAYPPTAPPPPAGYYGAPPPQAYGPQYGTQPGYPAGGPGYPAGGPGYPAGAPGYGQPAAYPQQAYYGQPQPQQVVYVREERREKDRSAETCCLIGLCSALLCCCLMD